MPLSYRAVIAAVAIAFTGPTNGACGCDIAHIGVPATHISARQPARQLIVALATCEGALWSPVAATA